MDWLELPDPPRPWDLGKDRLSGRLERISKEINRCSRVVEIFPNSAAVIRLVGAVLGDMHGEWQADELQYDSYPDSDDVCVVAIGRGQWTPTNPTIEAHHCAEHCCSPPAPSLATVPTALDTAPPGSSHPESGRRLRLIVSAAPCGWTGLAPQDAYHEFLAPRSSSSVTIPVKSLRAIRPVFADRPAPAIRLKNAWFSQRVGRSCRNSPLR